MCVREFRRVSILAHRTRISLATWQAGGETFFTAVLRDITDRKQTEETLHRYADELEGYVADDLWPLPTYQEMLFIK